MARNKSEKLPSCPEAHAYAEACEAVLDGANQAIAVSAWAAVPYKYMPGIDRSGPPHSANWRQRRIRFIRKTYGS